MNWLNTPTSIIRKPEYAGSGPVPRATWWNLLNYCAEQENGGRIAGARGWVDRRWQQTCGVTSEEVAECCDLWRWDGDDLVIWGYPEEKEAEIQAKRLTAQINGAKGGRKRKGGEEPAPETHPEPTSVPVDNQHRSQDGNQDRNPPCQAEREEMERYGREGEGNARDGVAAGASPPPRLAAPGNSLSSPPLRLVVLPAPLAVDGPDGIRSRLAALWPDAPKAWTAPELRDLEGSQAVLAEMSDDDWQAIAAWKAAPPRLIGRKTHWPRDRREHVEHAGEVLELVRLWWRSHGREWTERQKRQKSRPPAPVPPAAETGEPSAEDLAEMHRFLAQPFTPGRISA